MIDRPLESLGVLVTRPAHQAERLCELIEAAGGQPHRLPLIEITPPEDEGCAREQLARLADFDIVIFISANAVQRCYLYIGKAMPAGVNVACVGRATAREFEQVFARPADLVPENGFNSEALLATPDLQSVGGKKILLLKGEGGRELLAQTLADRGADVSYANLYKRILPEGAGQQLSHIRRNQDVDMIVFTSGEAIDNLDSLLDDEAKPWLAGISCLVIHPRLVERANRLASFKEVIVSDGPADEQVLSCIEQWFEQNKNK